MQRREDENIINNSIILGRTGDRKKSWTACLTERKKGRAKRQRGETRDEVVEKCDNMNSILSV